MINHQHISVQKVTSLDEMMECNDVITHLVVWFVSDIPEMISVEVFGRRSNIYDMRSFQYLECLNEVLLILKFV